MFVIEIVCITWFLCQEPPLQGAVFGTRPQCERALKVVYESWRPAGGSYKFNCRPDTAQRLRFGRFLNFITTVINPESMPANLTEGRFRSYWEQTDATELPVLIRNQGQHAQVSPEIRDWVRGLKDKRGVGCCDTADGHPTEVEWDTEREHYRVRIDGTWHVVPPEAVIDGPNKLGYAVVWYWHENGRPKIRCFIAGAGG
jgi:hypothetical protein